MVFRLSSQAMQMSSTDSGMGFSVTPALHQGFYGRYTVQKTGLRLVAREQYGRFSPERSKAGLVNI